MKILLPIDGSDVCLEALTKLPSLAGLFRERPEFALVNVHHELAYKGAAAWAGKEAVKQYYEELIEEALRPAREKLKQLGYTFSEEKRIGDPATEVAKLAKTGGFDLIVMGTHGHGGLKALVLGSVSSKILALSEVPILFAK